MKSVKLAVWVSGAVLAAALVVMAQDAKRVVLHIVALDDHQQPVRNLTAQDFRVTDDGKAPRILSFGPDSHSGPDVKPVVLILFDLLNANQFGVNYAQQEIEQTLQHSEISDSIYLYVLTDKGNLVAVHGLTDHDVAVPWTQQIKPLLDKTVNDVFQMRPIAEQVLAVRFDSTMRGLEYTGSQLAEIPGRKNIIWITHGISAVNSPRLVRFADQLDQNDITLNAIERGDQPSSYDLATLRQLAELTGGTLYDSNLDQTIAEVIAESKFSYRLEFEASAATRKYHKIRVTTSRKGVHVQTKQSYFW